MAIKKKFIDVELALIGDTVPVLGEPELLNKKTIKLDLSRKLKGRGLEVTFLILNKDKKLTGYPKDLVLMRSYIQRMMRPRVNYVEDSFDISCTDIPARIKPFLITRKKVSRAIRNSLRKTVREFLIEYCKGKTYMELAQEVIFGTIQKEMYPKLKKVYPLSLCEIRILETKQIEKADLTVKERVVEKKEAVIEEKTQAEELEEAAKAGSTEKKTEGEVVLDQVAEIEKEKETEVVVEDKQKKSKKKKEDKEDSNAHAGVSSEDQK
jgi:ribosomal protein S3AE